MPKPRALLLSLTRENAEMEELIFSLGYDLAGTVRQSRPRPDPDLYLGRGKMVETLAVVRQAAASLVVVNAQLKPGQLFNLQRFLNSAPTRVNARFARRAARNRRIAAERRAEDGEFQPLSVEDLLAAEDSAPPSPEGAPAPAPSPLAAHGTVVRPEAPTAAPATPALSDEGPIEVYDRVRVILEIFRQRAQSQEARLQVELAQLHYETPLVKEYIHLAKKGEHPGFLAGGDYEVSQYHDMMKRRMTKIRRDLDKISRERDVRRKHRRRGGFHLLSLAGYTNAGKSSLLQALAGEATLVENRYFSTLGTKTRRARSDRREILVTDTVGFIEDLPPWIVEAFHSTLEEIALADAILLVVDASDPLPEVRRKLGSSLRILWEFESSRFGSPRLAEGRSPAASRRGRDAASAASPTARGAGGISGLAPIVVVLNKVDLVSEAHLADLVRALEEDGRLGGRWVAVSAKTGAGVDALYDAVYAALPAYDVFECTVPQGEGSEALLAWLHGSCDVLSVEREERIRVRFEAKQELRREIDARLLGAGAVVEPRDAGLGEPAARVPGGAEAASLGHGEG